MTPKKQPSVKEVLFEILALVLFLITPPAIAYFDILVLGVPLREQSTTEVTQHLCLATCCILFALGARQYPEKRGYLSMIAFTFLVLLIREHNFYFNLIIHGLWQVPAIIAIIVGIVFVRRHRATIRQPLLDHFQTRGFAYAIVGLILLIFFSRLYGSGGLQRAVHGEAYNSDAKMFIQEGTELLGYAILLFGSIVSYRQRFSN